VTKSSKKSHKSEFNVILPPAVTIDYILFYHSKVWGFQFLMAFGEVYLFDQNYSKNSKLQIK